MNNVLTYIEWRGDLSFSQSGFNEVDNLIFALLSYFDFRGILPAPGEGELTLERASQLYFQDGDLPSRPSKASNSGKTLQWIVTTDCQFQLLFRLKPCAFLVLLNWPVKRYYVVIEPGRDDCEP